MNRQGQVLAASDGRNLAGLRLLQMQDVLPERLQRPRARAAPCAVAARFAQLGDQHVLAQAVGSTPWTLLFVASPGELNAVILPRLVPYGIILAGTGR